MAIKKLHNVIKKVSDETDLWKIGSCTLAIDGSSWLNQDIKQIYQEIDGSEAVATMRCVNKFMARVNNFKRFDIEPYIVFEGADLPIDNSNKKEKHHEQVYVLIQALKREKVSYVVAPYEADAQLAYLCLKGYADAVLTCDSDLIAYGCKKIIFWDRFINKYTMCEWTKVEGSDDFKGFTQDMVLQACILGGCDYFSITGVGLSQAIRAMRKHAYGMRNGIAHLERVIRGAILDVPKKDAILKDSISTEAIRGHVDWIKNTMGTFKHQIIYDPESKLRVNFTNIEIGTNIDSRFIGSTVAEELAKGIASGDIHPVTQAKMQELQPINEFMSGYVYSDVMAMDEEELERHLKMEKLYKSTSDLMVFQRGVVKVARSRLSLLSTQIVEETKHSNVLHMYGNLKAETSNVLAKEISRYCETRDKVIEDLKEYIDRVHNEIFKPLEMMLKDGLVPKARAQAEDYSLMRQEAKALIAHQRNVENMNEGTIKLEELKEKMRRLATSTWKELDEAKSEEEKETVKIFAKLGELEKEYLVKSI